MRISLSGLGRYPALVLAGMLAVSAVATAQAADSWDAPDSKWRQGPVKYLLSRDEDQAYKKLKTNEERAAFVEDFWGKRDPSPGTPENEYRDTFFRLAREAAARFSEEGGKGWQDDRGRVYILLGPPDEITEASSLLSSGLGSSGGESPPGGGGFGAPGGGDERPATPIKSYRFIYVQNPLGGGDRLELNFRGDVTGGYRLGEKIDWSHPVLRGLSPSARAAAAPAPVEPPAAPAAELPPSPEVPAEVVPEPAPATPQSDLMEMVRAATDLKATIPLDVTVNFYKAADKSTFATLTLEVKRSSIPPSSDPDAFVISAEIVDEATGESAQRFFKAEHFGPAEGNASAGINDTLLFQAERPLNPGRYKAIFAVKDPATGEIGTLEKVLDVPGYGEDDFTLSTVTLARRIEHIDAPLGAEGTTPFVLGSTRVVPRPDNVYKEGEELSFYYQIYGAAMDPVLGMPKLDLSYAFEKNVSGQWRMVGGRPMITAGQTRLVHYSTFQTKGWPTGDYRVSIKVTDTIGGKETAAEIPFTIQGPAKGSKAKSKG